jgi:hypothetical protein
VGKTIVEGKGIRGTHMATDEYSCDWMACPVSITIDPTRESASVADLIIEKWRKYQRKIARDLKKRVF